VCVEGEEVSRGGRKGGREGEREEKRKFTKTGAQEYLVKSHTALRVELHFFPQCIILITNMLV